MKDKHKHFGKSFNKDLSLPSLTTVFSTLKNQFTVSYNDFQFTKKISLPFV